MSANRPALRPAQEDVVARMRALSAPALEKLYRPEQGVFAFRVRKTKDGNVIEGTSPRYTAIALIGLSSEPRSVAQRILSDQHVHDICDSLLRAAATTDGLGDLALAIWAARANACEAWDPALQKMKSLLRIRRGVPTVEVAWVLSALCTLDDVPECASLRDEVAQRLLRAFNARSGLFPHLLDASGARSHVSCFADLVYPIQALSHYHRASGEREALCAAEACAARICEWMGAAGQWWWHYDYRTGSVIEGYPVYAVHQDAMAPMALFALADAGGTDYSECVGRGLDWLAQAPEIGGRSLIDDRDGWIWRKVARFEPRKLMRRAQAVASRAHPALRVPGLGLLLRPGAIDFESRPYHYGWLLHAFPAAKRANAAKPAIGATR